MIKKFQDRINLNNEKLKIEEKKHSLVGNIKLILFISILFFIVLFFTKKISTIFFGIEFFLILALVIVSIIQHLITNKINYHLDIIRINNDYLCRIERDFDNFKDIGDEFINQNHNYSHDLDIVGNKSLFQLINISKTFLGRQKFSQDLLNPEYNESEILRRQEAIEELSSKIDFSQNFEHYSSQIKDTEEIKKTIDYLSDNNIFMTNNLLRNFFKYFPVFVTILTLATFIFNINILKLPVTILLVIQTIIMAVFSTKTISYLQNIMHYKNRFDRYKTIFEIIEKENFISDDLKNIKNILFLNANSITAMKQLNSIIQKLNLRSNTLIYLVLNILLLIDIECALGLQSWREKYSAHTKKWFDSIAYLESLLSFSVLNNIVDLKVYPSINDNSIISAETMGHPLLKNDKRVSNHFLLDNNIFIVSGSNMSGKTTFLRTIGINLILAYNGAVVCADSLNVPIVKVITSMRISDNLNEGISTFYAELLKIKSIVSLAKKDSKIIFLIDEIFKGTNSKDRILGAKSVIENLERLGTIGLITTHDLELCSIINSSRIKNCHFRENYTKDKIIFDYTLQDGISTTTNAEYLMKMIGIL